MRTSIVDSIDAVAIATAESMVIHGLEDEAHMAVFSCDDLDVGVCQKAKAGWHAPASLPE